MPSTDPIFKGSDAARRRRPFAPPLREICMPSNLVSIRTFIGLTLSFLGLTLSSTTAQADELSKSSSKPNLLIFLADDLGSADVPWRGGNYAMPVLDALAKESARLESHYVHPMCSPTRAALLSGRYASRFGCTGAQNELVYPVGTVTLASALQSVGYRTALTGKWHLGSKPEWGPNHYGFDESYGSLAGGVGPYVHQYKTGPFEKTWHRNEKLLSEEGHVTDLIAREAVRFVEAQSAAKPFFLYVPFTAVHVPISEPQEWLDRNSHIADAGTRLQAACASHMDDAIGRVLAALDNRGFRDNTIVVFFSDNGGHDASSNVSQAYAGDYPNVKIAGHNTPLRGFKSQLYDGGIRSATIIRWPGRIAPGLQIDQPTHTVDFFPTFAKFAGYEPPQDLRWDGHDLGSLLLSPGNKLTPALADRTVYCSGVGYRGSALRQGRWKLIVDRKNGTELYDLVADPGESRNLASAEPERAAKLKALMQAAAAADRDSVTEETRKKPAKGD
ncbi:MAG: sulfatase [Pirellula sp.]|nr:sulfatase [Pirellula sp.]